MRLMRKLDALESLFAGTGNYPSDAVVYRGTLDELSLRRAFQLVCAKYPVLCAQLIRDSSGWHMCIPETRESQVRILDGGTVELKQELRSLRSEEDAAARLIVCRGHDSGIVALAVNHALADNPGFSAIFNDLWELYTQIVSQRIVSLDLNPDLPTSAESLLRRHWIQGKEEPASATSIATNARGSRRANANRVMEHTICLSQVETEDLVRTARNNGTTVHGVVCGAILLALMAQAPSIETARMACRSVVNLRDRVSPPVGNTETTVFQGMHRVDLMVSHSSTIVELGKQVREDLEQSISSRELQMLWHTGKRRLDSELPPHLRQILVTNVGIVPTPSSPPDLEFLDRVIVGWLDGEQISWIAVTPIYLIRTYNGKLRVAGMYPTDCYSADDVTNISKEIAGQLRSI